MAELVVAVQARLAAAGIDGLGGAVRTVHFGDHMEGDRMGFDYRMRDGVVARSNALALMKAVGLSIDDAEGRTGT